MYSDDAVARLYDVLNPWGPGDDFYLALALTANSVLDVGCGTGQILLRARAAGHQGRLCGLDPDLAMLGVASRRASVSSPGIEFTAGAASSMTWRGEFELAIMTGHAFQCLLTDTELRDSLGAIRRALADGGRFAFETRNPARQAWQSWHPGNARDAIDPDGLRVSISHRVESVSDGVVTLTETTSDGQGVPLRVDRASLRFLDTGQLAGFLTEAGFTIEAQFGDWLSGPVTPASPEIITIASA